MTKKRNVFFDLDGTIIDSFPEIEYCIVKALEELNIEMDKDLTRSMIGPPLDEILREIVPKKNLDQIVDIKKAYFKIYENFCESSKLYNGVRIVLERLSQKNNLYVLTNKSEHFSKKIINSKKISSFFVDILCVDTSEDSLSSKSKVLESRITNCKLSPKDSFLIGDSMSDFNASSHNKIEFFFASWGYGECLSDKVNEVKSFKDLLNISLLN